MMRIKELALEIPSRSLRMQKCLQDIHTSTDTYSVLVIAHPWFHTGKDIQTQPEHLI